MARAATDFYLVAEIASRLRVDTEQVDRWIAEGRLTAIVVPPDIVRISPLHLRLFIRAFSRPWPGWRDRADHQPEGFHAG